MCSGALSASERLTGGVLALLRVSKVKRNAQVITTLASWVEDRVGEGIHRRVVFENSLNPAHHVFHDDVASKLLRLIRSLNDSGSFTRGGSGVVTT